MTESRPHLSELREQFEARLRRALELPPDVPERLAEAMKYAVLAPGKRVRPLLVYGACEAVGLPLAHVHGVACAIEIIHAYSLIHDDLPAMDDDDLRRGRPTCHKAFDEATAILAGDALQALAFEILARDTALAQQPRRQARIMASIACACGAAGMAGGQDLDLAAVGHSISLDALRRMHELKTGALIQACVTSPALLAGVNAELMGRLERYGAAVGLAFQVHDDILDVTGCSESTGKSTQKDARQLKPTFPGLMGLEPSQREAERLRDLALAELDGFPGNCDSLRELAAVVVSRDS
ncbi:MAG: polyprenyl synthetase family protein [Xanthomonadales bacterium]|nr:polyprenyl synthetase family protein [Xanthomonadales bacterium]